MTWEEANEATSARMLRWENENIVRGMMEMILVLVDGCLWFVVRRSC